MALLQLSSDFNYSVTDSQDKKFWKEVEKWNSPTREILFRDKNKHISHDAHALWDPWRNQTLCAQASPQWYIIGNGVDISPKGFVIAFSAM